MEDVKLQMVTEWCAHRPEEIAIMGGLDHMVRVSNRHVDTIGY